MAIRATSTHYQGRGLNLEGPLRLSVPASLGSVGKCRESEDGRVCSRNRKCDMDYLYGKDIYKNGDRQEEIGLRCDRDIYAEEDIYGYKNDKDFVAAAIAAGGTKTKNRRFVMDAIDAERTNVGEEVPSMDGRYLWDINMADRRLIVPRGSNTGSEEGPPGFVNQVNGWNASDDEEQLADLEANAGNQNGFGLQQRVVLAPSRAVRPEDLNGDRKRQALAKDANALGHGGGGDHVPQVIPGVNDNAVNPIADIEWQNRNMVNEAARVSREMKVAIVKANDMLEAMRKANSKIPQELIDDMVLHLETSVVWLVEQIDRQDGVNRHLVDVQSNLEDEVEHLADQNQQLLNQLAMERRESPGLSSAQIGQLKLLGISNVDDLINKYRNLQDQVKQHQSLSRTTSKLSLASTQVSGRVVSNLHQPQGEIVFSSLGEERKTLKAEVKVRDEVSPRKSAPKFPKLEKFKGKTRVDLERFFRYFEPYAKSLSMGDSEKALMVGYYLPTLQYQHDSLMQRNASYEEVKRELLNALGSDSSVTVYSLRTALDKIVKPADKTYRELLETVERKVAEAFGADQGQREQELKKILLRLTQEDLDTSYNSTILPHTSCDYYRLKELVLGTEDANKLRKRNIDAKKSFDRKYATKFYPSAHSPRNKLSPKGSPETSPRKYSKDGGMPQRSFGNEDYKREQGGQKGVAKCYACEKLGHFARDCPKQREAQVVQEDDELAKLEYTPDDEEYPSFTVGGIVPLNAVRHSRSPVKMFGEKTHLETHFDGVKITSMLDSGASVSVINEKALIKILRDKARSGKVTRERKELYKRNGLVGADGSKLNVVDCVRIPISWGVYPPAPAIFFVVTGLQQDALIGTNVLKNNPVWRHALDYALTAKDGRRVVSSFTDTQKVEVKDDKAINRNALFVGSISLKFATTFCASVVSRSVSKLKICTPLSCEVSLKENFVKLMQKGIAFNQCDNCYYKPPVGYNNEIIGKGWRAMIAKATDFRERDNPGESEATVDVGKAMPSLKAKKSLVFTQEPLVNSSKGRVELECRGQSLVNVNQSKCSAADYQQPAANWNQHEKYGAVNFDENCFLLYRALLCIRDNVSNMPHEKKKQHQQQCRSTSKKSCESKVASIKGRDQSTCKWKKTHLNAYDMYECLYLVSPKSNVISCSRHQKVKSCHQSMKCNNYGRAECSLQSENQINSKKSIHYRGR